MPKKSNESKSVQRYRAFMHEFPHLLARWKPEFTLDAPQNSQDDPELFREIFTHEYWCNHMLLSVVSTGNIDEDVYELVAPDFHLSSEAHVLWLLFTEAPKKAFVESMMRLKLAGDKAAPEDITLE